MFLRYRITINGQLKGEVYALSAHSAKEKAYNTYGSASRYSGIGFDNIEVERV